MSKIVQIGSGMIGTTMAYDLSQEHHIIVGDFDDSSFAKTSIVFDILSLYKLSLNIILQFLIL